MRGYLEDLKAGGRPMTDKELAEHYKHLYSELKKQKDDVVEFIKHFDSDEICENITGISNIVLRMLGEIDD